MTGRFSKFVMAMLKPPLEIIGFVIGTVYRVFFGSYEIKVSKQHEDALVRDLGQHLKFLIEEGAEIIPDASLKHPRAFDYATVIIVVDAKIFFRFIRGRGELRVQIAYGQPDNWSDLPWLLSILDVPGWTNLREFSSLTEVADTLRHSISKIREAFSMGLRRETEQQLSDMHERERVAAKQLQTEINRNLYPDR